MAVKINEFVLPDFMLHHSAEEIHARMMDGMPVDIDKSEGGFPWDFTRPTALEKAEMVEFILSNAIKNIFPQYAEGIFLDYHAANRGLIRRPPGYAAAKLKVTGIAGTRIPKNFKVSTEAAHEESGVVFLFDEEVMIPESGILETIATAEQSGVIGNVNAETIRLQVKPMKGIVSLINEAPAYGGYSAEDDELLRQRIAEYDLMQGLSFVGSMADYRRWASEVVGVGSVEVIPANDETGLVTLIVMDNTGNPASLELCESIYNHIMRPDSPYERLAPINANLKVMAPKAVPINVQVKVFLEENYDNPPIDKFKANLIEYFKNLTNNTIRKNEILAVLINTEGILNYAAEQISATVDNQIVNYATLYFSKYKLKPGEMPAVGKISMEQLTEEL